jgi:arsenite-transporting ATPase
LQLRPVVRPRGCRQWDDAWRRFRKGSRRRKWIVGTDVRNLLPRLRDPRFTRVLIVTLPEATPVHEAAKLREDLVRAGIRPFAWVINQSLSPPAVRDPVLLARKQHESAYLREVTEGLAVRASIIPWLTETPVGAERLQAALCGRQDAQPLGGVTNHGACCQLKES